MSHSLTFTYLHVIFATKSRYPFLTDETIRRNLEYRLTEISLEMETRILEIRSVIEHIHILINLSQKISLAEWVKEIKRSSSLWVQEQGGELLSEFHWQNGYSSFSVSKSNLFAVKKYIQNQDEHHRKVSFQDEVNAFIRKYKITNTNDAMN